MQKSSTIDFCLGHVKLFVSLFLTYIFYFVAQMKNKLQKEVKDWTHGVYLLTGESSSWFLQIESLKMTCAKPYT